MQSTTQQLASIQARLTSAQQKNLQQFQKQILSDLYTLKQTFLQELKTVSTTTQQTKSAPATQEDDPKDKQIKQLKAQNVRLQYRIQHLVRNLKQRL